MAQASNETGGRRVVVIDDNVDAAQSLAAVLDLLGFKVSVAFDGNTGLALAERDRPDAVICDIAMPGMDGYEVAHRLARNERVKAAKRIAITGFADRHDRIKAFEAGFEEHLTKPVDLPALLSALRGSRRPH